MNMWDDDEPRKRTLCWRDAVASHVRIWVAVSREVPGRDNEQCRQRWTKRLDPNIRRGQWTPEEDARLLAARASCEARQWTKAAEKVGTRTNQQCSYRWKLLRARAHSHRGKVN